MGYRPLQIKGGARVNQARSFTPTAGLNKRDLPQLLKPEQALIMTNYISDAVGRLRKREGLTQLFTVGGTSPIQVLEKFDTNRWIFAYGTTVAEYNRSTDTITNIKTDFTAGGTFAGARYGKYFFISNGIEKIFRLEDAGPWTATEVAGSSPCTVMRVIGARLFTNSTTTGEVKYARIDSGTNPPFTDWTADDLADGPGGIVDRHIGNITSIEPLGQNIVVFGDFGKFAFFINTIDSAGTLSKVEVTQMSRRDFGGASGAITTDQGLFYVNEAGLWQLLGVGQPDTKFSDQEALVSKPLGVKYFDNATLTNVDIAYDEKQNFILVTYAAGSATNNAVLCYNLETKAFSEFSGWTMNRFASDQGVLYGGSSVTGTVYQLFDGYDDNGLSIGTEFEQEISIGSLETLKDTRIFKVEGYLTQGQPITISFNVYDRTGRLDENRQQFTWTATNALGIGYGYDEMAYDYGAYDGDIDFSDLVYSPDGAMTGMKRIYRLRVNFSASDTAAHEINLFSIDTVETSRARVRQMTKV
jgi:hypothetical protein